MAQPFNEVQIALVTALRVNTAVQAAMTGAASPTWNIFDNVPTSQVYPYLYIGDMQAGQGTVLVMGGKATDLLVTIHVFSALPGWSEVQKIVTAIDNLINEQILSLANGFTVVRQFFDNYIPLVQPDGPDGKTRHGALRYRFWVSGG